MASIATSVICAQPSVRSMEEYPPDSADIVVDGDAPLQRFSGFGATTISLVYPNGDHLTPQMRALAIQAVYGEVGLTMGQVEPGLMETPADATDLWSQRRNDNDDPFSMAPSGFNWSGSDAMREKVIELARPYGLNNWSLANKINTRYSLSFLEPLRVGDYQRFLDEAAEHIVAGLVHWRDAYGIVPRWVAPWNEPTSGNGEIVGASTQTLVDLVKTIGRRMADSGFGSTRLVVPNEETVARSFQVASAMLADTLARRYIGAIGYHAYPYESPYSSARQILETSGRGLPSASEIEMRRRLRELGQQYDVPLWLTEISEGPGNNDYPFPAFENLICRAIHIHDEIRYAGASAYYGMNAMWDRRSHEEHFAGRNIDFFNETCSIALVDLDSVYISGMGYAIGHYARFLDSDAVVLDSRSSDSLVQVTAFRIESGGRLVVVIINNAGAPRAVRITTKGLRPKGEITGEQSNRQYRWRPMVLGISGTDPIGIVVDAETVTTLTVGIEGSAGATMGGGAERNAGLVVDPNPTNGPLHVRSRASLADNATLALFDMTGRCVWTKPLHANRGTSDGWVNVGGIESGLYRLVLRSGTTVSSVAVAVGR